MKRLFFLLASVAIVSTLLVTGCSQAAPAPAPTKAAEPTKAAAAPSAAAPTKAAEPTKAAAAPAAEVAWPEKGKSIQLIVGSAAGGSTDTSLRPLIAAIEKDLGVPIQYENNGGAGGQVAATKLSTAKPDGYTFGTTLLPVTATMYLDSARGAVFNRTSFQPVALWEQNPQFIGVSATSPYKILKDLIDAAKAKPESIKDGTAGILTPEHLAGLRLQQLTGTKFATVAFSSGSADVLKALLGDHIDMAISSFGLFFGPLKSNQVRLLSINDKNPHPLAPDVPTTMSQGIDLTSSVSRLISAPAGTPRPIVDKFSAAFKKAISDPAYAKPMSDLGLTIRYMDPDQTSKFWADYEKELDPLVKEYLASQKK